MHLVLVSSVVGTVATVLCPGIVCGHGGWVDGSTVIVDAGKLPVLGPLRRTGRPSGGFFEHGLLGIWFENFVEFSLCDLLAHNVYIVGEVDLLQGLDGEPREDADDWRDAKDGPERDFGIDFGCGTIKRTRIR